MKIYTKTGDEGMTSMLGGKRISKHDAKIHAFGAMDHVNSWVGLFCAATKEEGAFEDARILLGKVQKIIFQIGSVIACDESKRASIKLPKIEFEVVEELERSIDAMEAQLEPLKYFILPGGTVLSSYAHICRTEVRGLERDLVGLYQEFYDEDIPWKDIMKIFNRLSDYLFVLARYVNKQKNELDVSWIP